MVLPLALKWYFCRIPKFSQAYLNGTLTGVRHAVRGGIGFTLAALVIALVCGLLQPRWMKPPVVAVLLVCGLGMIGAGEYLREFLRKPWVIDQVVYANDMRVSQIEALQAKGVSHTANFTADRRHGEPGVWKDICSTCNAAAATPRMDTAA